jgi:uncharacterized protein YbjT (DUF2867 family)
MSRSVLLLGATGLVGNECLKLLLQHKDISRIVTLTRSLLPITHDKLVDHLVDFESLDFFPAVFAVDAVICALGTTIKQAGSQKAFRKVDHDYPLAAARIAIEHNVRHFLLVSALGADSSSKVFYNRVKGDIEKAISELNFHSTTIVRPSLLLGDRKEFRVGEQLGKYFTPLIPMKYKPIHAKHVAHQLIHSVIERQKGIRIIENEEIHKGIYTK